MSLALAVLVGTIGAAASVVGAASVAGHADASSHRALEDGATAVVKDLGYLISHEGDLLSDAAALFSSNLVTTTQQLQAWIRDAAVGARYPELQSLTKISATPGAGGSATCRVELAGYLAAGATALPTDVDLCATPMAATLLDASVTTLGTYVPNDDTTSQLYLIRPLYRRAAADLRADAERIEARDGWIVIGLRVDIALEGLTRGRPKTAFAVTHSGTTVARAGSAPAPHQTLRHALGDGWTIAVTRSGAGAGALDPTVLAVGLAASVLVALLVATGGSLASVAARLRARTHELHANATHDALTGLANRAEIQEHAARQITTGAASGGSTGVLHLGIDDFKAINEAFGYPAGDELLRASAIRLGSCLRDVDVMARVGGDEFVIVLGGPVDDATTRAIAARLLAVMRAPFRLPGVDGSAHTTVSIGAVVSDTVDADANDLLAQADLALHEAKRAGKNGVYVFHPQTAALQKLRVELRQGVGQALAEGQFRLVYQPIWRTDDEEILGVEALLRWDHPTLGTVEPDQFIPELESNGHIVEVGRWVLDEACRQAAAWQVIAPNLAMSVNTSARQFADDRILRDVSEALARTGLPADMLTLEITETALMADPSVSAGRLQALRDLGCHVAIDDFGVGYSSLGYLQMFPADGLKIDHSFVSALGGSPESVALVRAIVQLADDLGMHALAEGVETPEQLAILRDQRVRFGQGYLVSRPLTPEALEERLRAGQRQMAVPTATSPATS